MAPLDPYVCDLATAATKDMRDAFRDFGMDSKRNALLAISLVGFVPTLSILMTLLVIDGELASQAFFILCKAWLLFIPTYWFLRVEGNPLSWSPSDKNGIFEGVVTGVAMSVIIFVVWMVLGDSIDTKSMVEQLQNTGLTSIEVYVAGMFYWIFLNSMLEEYVFRWFITVKGIELTGSESGGIIVSALMFTLHHALALHLFGFEWWQTGIACFGLISAAAIWSWLYIRHRSIWVCWISHAICDVAVFAIGYQLVFN